MKTIQFFIFVTVVALFAGCAATVPNELVNAREAYHRASNGPAASFAPAELHVANKALAKAEQSFKDDSDSYQTRDLAYVAQRKSEIAEATASIVSDQASQARAKKDYQRTQGKIITKTKQDLSQTRTELTESERSGAVTADKLSSEKKARIAADQRTVDAHDAEMAADQRAAVTLAALVKLAAVKEDPRGIIVTLNGSVLFASNQATLLPAAKLRLNQVADVLLTTRERNLSIEGHTDSQGSDSDNLDLSQRRSDAVRNYLVQRGYLSDRIQSHGLGEGHPVADNTNAEGRANNRRVEIIIERETHASN